MDTLIFLCLLHVVVAYGAWTIRRDFRRGNTRGYGIRYIERADSPEAFWSMIHQKIFWAVGMFVFALVLDGYLLLSA